MPATTERLHLSEIAPRIMQSEIRSMTVECDAVEGVNLAQGVCDTPLPASVMEAAIGAIHDGFNIYTRLDGVAVLHMRLLGKQADKLLDDPEGGHADERETSVMLALDPRGVRMDRLAVEGDFATTGATGDPSRATAFNSCPESSGVIV